MTGVERGTPPADEPGTRAERELLPLAGLEEQVIEAIERHVCRFGRGDEALPCPTGVGAAVVADHDDAGFLRATDPLSGGLRDGIEDAFLVRIRREWERDTVARRLDLL